MSNPIDDVIYGRSKQPLSSVEFVSRKIYVEQRPQHVIVETRAEYEERKRHNRQKDQDDLLFNIKWSIPIGLFGAGIIGIVFSPLKLYSGIFILVGGVWLYLSIKTN